MSEHIWEGADGNTDLGKSILSLNADYGMALDHVSTRPVRQQDLSSQIDAASYRQLLGSAPDRQFTAHLKAQEANKAEWQRALPCDGLDTHLSNRDLVFAIKDRLGVDVFTRSSRCTFCSVARDV